MDSHNQKKTILVVEDEPDIARIITAWLEKDGFEVIHAEDGDIAVRMVQQCLPDFIILDIKMPKKDGWTVLQEVRQFSDIPVLMLSAMDTDIDKVLALKTGADDYLVKPFNPAELVARVQVILRRMSFRQRNDESKVFKSRSLEVNQMTHQIFVGPRMRDISSSLTSTEFKIISHLMRHPQRVFSRSEIMAACFTTSDISDRTIDSHISKLRKKLEKSGIAHVPESVRGFGYRLGD